MEPLYIKLHSDRQIAAHVYHGWTLCGAFVDPESHQIYESLLKWELPEALRRPDEDEIKRFRLISVVEATFSIEDRGTVIEPGIPRSPKFDLKRGDLIVLVSPKTEKAFTSEIKEVGMLSPPSPKGWPILLSPAVSQEEVPEGTQVWMRDPNTKQRG
jgi:translation elongation factor EF-Tu-like GTPase